MDEKDTLRFEVLTSKDPVAGSTTTVSCHGRLISSNGKQLSEIVKPLIDSGGRILIDLTGVDYLDSSGLGTLVALKVSAINKGYCTLELINLTAKVQNLLSLTNLSQMFSNRSETSVK